MRKLFVLIFFLIAVSCYSQTDISGYIYDNKTHLPLADASVQIFNITDSLLIKGTSSATSGFFEINIEPGTYKLLITYTGYKNYVRRITLDSSENLHLDTIKLNPDGYSTVTIDVEAETPDMTFEDDKKVFDVTKLSDTKGGTALDVLRKIPMIDVDMQDNVTLRGNSKIQILIDNKPMKFSNLRQIPADAIKKVEIITNPSAKYEAEGVTGIINLVMNEKNRDIIGYNGYIYAGSKTKFNSGYGNFGFNINKDKWTFFINGGGGIWNSESYSENSTVYDNNRNNFYSNGNYEGNSKYGYISFGAEREVYKNNIIGTDFNFNISKGDNFGKNINTTFKDLTEINSVFTSSNAGNYNGNNFGISLYYTGKFDEKRGHELNSEFYFSRDFSKSDNSETQYHYDSLLNLTINPPIQNSYNDDRTINIRFSLDYTKPISDNIKIETGIKSIARYNDIDNELDTLNYTTNQFEKDYNFSNQFLFDEYINAAYGTFSYKIKNFKFKSGLRLEHTYNNGDVISASLKFTKNYFNLFPSVSISQRISNSSELQLSYSRRITRPSMWRLNPFVNRSNSRFINFGNPELQPEFTNSFELGYNLFTNFFNSNMSLFYRKSVDVITTYSYLIDSISSAQTYRNGAKSTAYGADFIMRSSGIKWLNLNFTFSFYKSLYENDLYNFYIPEEGFTWRANFRAGINVFDFFKIDAYYNYNGKRFNSSGFSEPNQSFNLSISKDFFNKKLNISIRGDDIFKTRKWAGENQGDGFKRYYSSRNDSQSVYVNLSYNFGNAEKYYQKSKKTKQNENENQDEKNN